MLRQIGHEVNDLRGSGREGLSDQQIFDEAQQNESFFLTTDRDFFHTIPHLYEKHHGVIVIALRQPNRAVILEKLSWILQHLKPRISPIGQSSYGTEHESQFHHWNKQISPLLS